MTLSLQSEIDELEKDGFFSSDKIIHSLFLFYMIVHCFHSFFLSNKTPHWFSLSLRDKIICCFDCFFLSQRRLSIVSFPLSIDNIGNIHLVSPTPYIASITL